MCFHFYIKKIQTYRKVRRALQGIPLYLTPSSIKHQQDHGQSYFIYASPSIPLPKPGLFNSSILMSLHFVSDCV